MKRIMPTMRSLLLGAAAAALFVTSTYGQQSILGPPSEANHFIETPKGWVHPKTPWGEPDIQAMLDMMQANSVNLVRCAGGGGGGGGRAAAPPAAAGAGRAGAPAGAPGGAPPAGAPPAGAPPAGAPPAGAQAGRGGPGGPGGGRGAAAPCDVNKAWLTDEEYNQRVQAAAGRVDQGRALIAQGNFGRALLSGVTDPNMPQRQTSLIVDPPNGQLPALTAEGKKRALEMGSSWALPGEDPIYEGPLDFDFWDNCRSRGMPSSMMPYRYNGGFQILQAPGVVVFNLEMIHDARIIYTDGRPSIGGAIKEYMGESRGHWEGNTLVVETTNYKEGPPLINLAVPGSPAGNRFPVSDKMKTTERITRLNNDSWLYEIKTEDPTVLTRPFTVRYPMRNNPQYEWWEYGCHEGNSIIQNYSQTNKHEREHPPEEPEVTKAQVSPELANQLAGKWTGKPAVPTLDYNVFIEFTKNADGTVQGKLIGTDLKTFRGRVNPTINKALRTLRITGRNVNFELPNTQPWTFAGQVSEDGTTITGTFNSAQGGVPVTFRKG